MKDIGQTIIGQKGPDDSLTLKQKQFVIGDYLDVSVSVARAPTSGGGSGMMDRRDARGADTRDPRDGRDNRSGRSYRDYR